MCEALGLFASAGTRGGEKEKLATGLNVHTKHGGAQGKAGGVHDPGGNILHSPTTHLLWINSDRNLGQYT